MREEKCDQLFLLCKHSSICKAMGLKKEKSMRIEINVEHVYETRNKTCIIIRHASCVIKGKEIVRGVGASVNPQCGVRGQNLIVNF